MVAKYFLKEKLASLAVQFPAVRIKYAYNYSIATHVVELTPEEEYYNNEKLDNAWIPLSVEFSETFMTEEISFISSDSRLAIEKPEMEWNQPVEEWDLPMTNLLFKPVMESNFTFQLPDTFAVTETGGVHITIEPAHTHIGLTHQNFIQVSVGSIGRYEMRFRAEVEASTPTTQYAMAA